MSLQCCSSHLPSLEASEHAMYSASKVNIGAQSCFRDCQDMEPLEMNICPSVGAIASPF